MGGELGDLFGADLSLYDIAFFVDDEKGRHGLDVVALAERGKFIHVDFQEFDFARIFGS